MNREGDSIMLSILADPSDLVSRLAWADWLEDDNQPVPAESARESFPMADYRSFKLRERFFTDRIRNSLPSWGRVRIAFLRDGKLTVRSLIGNSEDTAFCFGEDYLLVVIRYGHVSEIALTPRRFLSFAEELFARHPIVGVVLTLTRPVENLWTLGKGLNTYFLSDVPPQLFHLLKGDDVLIPRGRVSRQKAKSYPSKLAALQDMSRACVSYGRQLAKLPDLKEPSPLLEVF